MSRHRIAPDDPHHAVFVGWDPPLQTYFAQMIDTGVGEDEHGRHALWVGTVLGEVTTVERLVELLRPFADVDSAVQAMLQEDRWKAERPPQWQGGAMHRRHP